MNQIDLNEISWYTRNYHPLFHTEIYRNKQTLMYALLNFIFDQLVSFIKSNFYVTEKHDGHNQLFYYSKPIWFLITQLGTLQMEQENLVSVKK